MRSLFTSRMDTLNPGAGITERSNEKIIDDICEYAYKLSRQDWKYIQFRFFAPYTHKCPICSKREPGERYGSNCICIPFACWRHGGHIPCNCSTHVINNSNWNRIARLPNHEEALAIARKRIGVHEIMLIRGENVMDSLQRGDACAHFLGGKYYHTSLYLGDGKMLDVSRETGNTMIRDVMKTEFAIRYIGGK